MPFKKRKEKVVHFVSVIIMHIFVNVIYVTFFYLALSCLFVPLTRLTLQWKPWPRPHTKGCSVGLFTALIKLWTEPSAKGLPLLASWTSLALRYSRCGFLGISAQLSLMLNHRYLSLYFTKSEVI